MPGPTTGTGGDHQLPAAVAELLASPLRVGAPAQAFPLLTTGESGHPHLMLLSAAELRLRSDGALLLALAGPTTQQNLLRSGQATLLAVEGTTVHVLKLDLARSTQVEGLLGAVMTCHAHKGDSLGIALSPLGFTPTEELATLERWDRSERVLDALDLPG